MAAILILSVRRFFDILYWLIIIRALLSWFRPRRYVRWFEDLERVLYALTEPILAPIRNALPMGPGIDFSPLVALLLLGVVRELVVRFLLWLL